MSSTVFAPYPQLGFGGNYPAEMNYGIRIYTNPPQNEIILGVGQKGATLKGGQRTNFHGLVPILDGNKNTVGQAEVLKIVTARPKYMLLQDIQACGFQTMDEAVAYVEREHGEEFTRDGVLTVYYYKVITLD